MSENTRDLEPDIVTDLTGRMSYGGYLAIDELTGLQRPVSNHHDEMLFIIQHQTTELWLKLILHELRAARAYLAADDVEAMLKCTARVKRILECITQQWSVLATLTPTEYAQFRNALGNSSGFQSHQYRAVEFILGNKNAAMLPVFRTDPAAQQMLAALLAEPSLYDAFIAFLGRRGFDIPASLAERDFTKAHAFNEDLVAVFKQIYEAAGTHWREYEACEELVDLEDAFQVWRFRHLRTVQRIIGNKRGTGGSSGAGFLAKALELTFFPELFAVRTQIEQ